MSARGLPVGGLAPGDACSGAGAGLRAPADGTLAGGARSGGAAALGARVAWWERGKSGVRRRGRSVDPRRAALLVLALIVGAYLAASGLASPVYARLSWLGVLPLLIAVRNCRPIHAGLCGAVWGSCYWLTAGLLLPISIELTTRATIQHVGSLAAFALLGALTTRKFGFHPLLLSATWVLLDLAFYDHSESGLSFNASTSSALEYFLAHAMGTVFLSATLVFCNAALLHAVCRLSGWFSMHRECCWCPEWFLIVGHSLTVYLIRRAPAELSPRAPPM